MSKSLTEVKSKQTAAFLNDVVEPKIQKMIEETNKVLRKRGVQVGCTIEWYVDKYEPEGQDDDSETD